MKRKLVLFTPDEKKREIKMDSGPSTSSGHAFAGMTRKEKTSQRKSEDQNGFPLSRE